MYKHVNGSKERRLIVNLISLLIECLDDEFYYTELTNLFSLKTHAFNLSSLCSSCARIASCSSELILTFLYAGSSI